MRRRSLVLSLASSLLVAAAATADEAAAPSAPLGTLTVVPVGLEENRGSVMIKLASSQADFDSEETSFRSATVKVENKSAVRVFEDLPHGEYAVKIFQDENENQKLDTNFVGIPKEKFGFSNNVIHRFGPSSYEESLFRFDAEEATIEIEMR